MTNPQSFSDDGSSEFNFSELLNAIIQHKWIIVAIFLITTSLGLAYAVLAEPRYLADALVQVEDRKGTVPGLPELADALGSPQSPVSGELAILRSRQVLMQAADQTQAQLDVRVANRFPIIGDWVARTNEKKSGDVKDVPSLFSGFAWGGEKLELAAFEVPPQYWGSTFLLERTETGYKLFDPNGDEVVAGEIGTTETVKNKEGQYQINVRFLAGRIGTGFEVVRKSPISVYNQLYADLEVVEAARQSGVIRISYENPNAEFAKNLVNAVAQTYLKQNVERRTAEIGGSLKFLEQKLPELKKSVESSEEALSKFRSSTGTISVPKETDGLLQRSIEMENNRLRLQLRRDEMLQRFRPEHPEVRAIDEQLAGIRREVGMIDSQIDRLPGAQKDLLRLERDVQVNSQLYIALLNNSQQLRVAEAGTVGNVRIIDFGIVNPAPVFPPKKIIVMVSMMLGIFLGLVGVFVTRMLRPTVQRAQEIEEATGLTTYVTVPESYPQRKLSVMTTGRRPVLNQAGAKLLALSGPDDPAVESLRSLHTGLAFALMGRDGKNIAITGATAGVGKSFVAANLAVLLAVTGKKILLVDADMRRPRLSEYCSYDYSAKGLSDLLLGGMTLEDVVKDVTPNLQVLPAGVSPPNPGELLVSERFINLVEEWSQKYDHILFDTPPILPVADTLAILPRVAVAFLVVRAEQSTTREVVDSLKKVESAGSEGVIRGLVFNGVKRSRVGYGSSYKYYYSYGKN
ncbi:polysaccharide biosynthesis tyrosine autokinase [Pigmentiphaga daeguensis]|uniref:Polysaccharide biosynthesis tyrosine autokinase n=1 Tax=Pigmentiphaga daeguensis TaxID=414049 RepID=A0ABP3N2P5_9BURK